MGHRVDDGESTTSSGARRSDEDGDNIVWGTSGEVDNIVWGTSSEEDNVTWGCAGEETPLFDDPDVPSVFDGTIFDALFDEEPPTPDPATRRSIRRWRLAPESTRRTCRPAAARNRGRPLMDKTPFATCRR